MGQVALGYQAQPCPNKGLFLNGFAIPGRAHLSENERSLAAIMFTDMVGFTALTQSDEAQSLQVLDRHNKLLRPIFPRFHGREVKTLGDSFLVEFDSALDATNCAIEIQRFLHDYNISSRDEWKISLRIGIHLGDVVHKEGDVFGDAVNIASRLQPLAEPEGVCISDQVYGQVRNKIPQPLVRMEPRELKGVRFPVEVYKVMMPWEGDQAAKTPAAGNRMAVLPFANMSRDPQDEFFADGLTEEMITELSRIRGLRVIARTSVMHYKNSGKGVQEIAKELNVESVLEGSVRKSGGRVRITAQLINAGNEEHLWADRYDRELHDIFEVQSDIATSVAGTLKMKLFSPSAQAPGRTENIEAYTLYLRGRFLWNQRTTPAIYEALKVFQRSLAEDSKHARAYAGIADCYSILVDRNEMLWSEGSPKAKEACAKVLELDDSLPEGHASMGLVLTREFDYRGAEREFKRATELNPGYASAYQWYSLMSAILGRQEDASRLMTLAEEADPLSPIILHNAGMYAWAAGRDVEALEKWKRALEISPGFSLSHFDLASYYIT